MPSWFPIRSEWRREALRTTLWLVPTIEVVIATALFIATYALDRAAYRGAITMPGWVNNGGADAARQMLIAIAAAVITVVSLVFSITIVALTLASTQFGPRMLRNFVRDRGTQITLGTFVATLVYSVLALGSIGSGSRGDFVPHLSVTIALGLFLASLGVLIYFIHHIAQSIQLPRVIAGIARDFSVAIDADMSPASAVNTVADSGPSPTELLQEFERSASTVAAASSGYLQFVTYDTLVAIAAESESVIQLLFRPGHFVVEGLPMAKVLPADAAPAVSRSLERAHFTGPHRTLAQDLTFAIDQLVEIAIRALSPAVNDTFTALTCIDWLTDGLCRVSAAGTPRRIHRDDRGLVRVVAAEVRYSRLVERAFDKIRQAGRGMPAVLIRQLEGLTKMMQYSADDEHRRVIRSQADMIMRSSDESVPEPEDRADVRMRYDALVAASAMPATTRMR